MNKILKIALIAMLLITIGLVAGAAATGGSASMIDMNLYWGYLLVALAVVSAIGCALFGMINAPEGLKSTGISLGLVIVVIGAAYAIASGNSYQIVNLGDGGFFGAEETVITETSVLVTYVAMGAAILVALLGIVFNSYEGLKK